MQSNFSSQYSNSSDHSRSPTAEMGSFLLEKYEKTIDLKDRANSAFRRENSDMYALVQNGID